MAECPNLVLASTSRYRQALLKRLGMAFQAVAPEVDEDLPPGLPTARMAALLAERKARAVAARAEYRDAVVIGCDQIAEGPGGERLSKPGSVARAEEELRLLQGKAHRLVTAVAVVWGGEVEVAVDVHTLHMWPLSDAEIAAYVARDEPLDCAGSYRLEALGIALFSRIESDPESADESAIVGLPVMKLLRILRARWGWTPLRGAKL